jgi:phage terminase small subunit
MVAKKPVKSAKPAKRAKKRVKAGTSKASAAHRRALFVEAYLRNGGNATQASIEAGFPPISAGRNADRLMKDSEISAKIASRRAELLAAAEKLTAITSEEVVLSMTRAVRFDPRKLFRPDGSMVPIYELDDDTALALQAIEVDEIKADGQLLGFTRKIKACDRNVAREQAHKFFGHYKEDNKQKGESAISALLAAVGLDAGKFAVKL